MSRLLLKDKVERILSERPPTRDSDIDLTLWVWYTYYRDFLEWEAESVDKAGRWIVALSNVRLIPSEDKISRIRRKFQEAGMYPATDPQVIARRNKEGRVKANINTPSWGETLDY